MLALLLQLPHRLVTSLTLIWLTVDPVFWAISREPSESGYPLRGYACLGRASAALGHGGPVETGAGVALVINRNPRTARLVSLPRDHLSLVKNLPLFYFLLEGGPPLPQLIFETHSAARSNLAGSRWLFAPHIQTCPREYESLTMEHAPKNAN